MLHIRLRKGSANTSRGMLRFTDELIARVERAGATGAEAVARRLGLLVGQSLRAAGQGRLEVLDRRAPATPRPRGDRADRRGRLADAGGLPADEHRADRRDHARRPAPGRPPRPHARSPRASCCQLGATSRSSTNRTEAIEIVEAEHRQHAVVELAIRDLKDQALAHFPSGHFYANAAWTVIAALAHNLLRWTELIGLPGRRDPRRPHHPPPAARAPRPADPHAAPLDAAPARPLALATRLHPRARPHPSAPRRRLTRSRRSLTPPAAHPHGRDHPAGERPADGRAPSHRLRHHVPPPTARPGTTDRRRPGDQRGQDATSEQRRATSLDALVTPVVAAVLRVAHGRGRLRPTRAHLPPGRVTRRPRRSPLRPRVRPRPPQPRPGARATATPPPGPRSRRPGSPSRRLAEPAASTEWRRAGVRDHAGARRTSTLRTHVLSAANGVDYAYRTTGAADGDPAGDVAALSRQPRQLGSRAHRCARPRPSGDHLRQPGGRRLELGRRRARSRRWRSTRSTSSMRWKSERSICSGSRSAASSPRRSRSCALRPCARWCSPLRLRRERAACTAGRPR